MKKLLAVIMSVVMAFSIAVVPASAADDEVTVEEFFEAIETSIALIEDTIAQVHNIVGTILGVLGKECPMCSEIHEVNLNVDVEVENPELENPEIEAPELELPETEKLEVVF